MAAKELNKVKIEVSISGKECDFSMLRLHQTMYGHHIFNIDINYRAKKSKKTVWSTNPVEILKDLLGSEVFIRMSETGGAASEFKGVIKRVNVKGRDANQGEVTIYGGSPTLLMTDDYTMNSFIDMDIASIVQQTLSDIGLNIEHKLNPMNTEEIPFVYRYKENSYDFLRRLISSCGENFWYDGRKIIIGAPSKEDEDDTTINYTNDMLEMNISSGLGNYLIEQYDYDHTRDELGQWISPFNDRDLDRYSAQIYKKSKEIHKDWTVMPGNFANRSISTARMAREAVVGEYFSKLSEESYVTGKSTTCKVAIGRVLKIETDPKIDDKEVKTMGRFRVVEVVHTYDNTSGEYSNDFKAYNAKTDHIPFSNIQYPTALPEVAKVIDNADPKNMGRVMVRYMWQQLDDHPQDKTSGWMRVQSPDAGSSDVVEKNRGFFFVPEIGDQVMVGYEYGDPNRPFVMGSLFHCNNSKGIADNNKQKSITTRSGSTLTIDDDAHTILLCTSKANQIFIDEKNGVIAITSAEAISLASKNINIDASENLTVNVGKDFNMTVGGDSNITVMGDSCKIIEKDSIIRITGRSEYNIAGEHNLTVAKALTLCTDTDANIEAGGQMKVASQKNMYVKSKVKVDIAKG